MKGKKILVAEDDPGIRTALKFVLADEGFDVVFAHDGEAALEAARAERPDAILLDHVMPKLDGRQVLEALRADESTRDVPVLLVTGLDPGLPAEWPGVSLVAKPFSPEVLVERIRSVLS